MINANELRVGNCISITGIIIRLTVETLAHILEQDGYETRCEGIPLTPEILERIGWKKFNEAGINIENGEVSIVIAGEYNYYKELPHIKFLHQLQNVYFDFTGEEFEIKEFTNNRRKTVTLTNNTILDVNSGQTNKF